MNHYKPPPDSSRYKLPDQYYDDLDKANEPDITKCPKCKGPADNGFDRCLPPNPYYCKKYVKNDKPDDPRMVIKE